MVYGFAKQSGGGISINSKLREGTRVEIWLPRAEDAECELTPPQRDKAGLAAPPGARSLHILLVDDHASVRTTTAALLTDLGHNVVEASVAPEAMAVLEREMGRLDLIITDYAMPLMSGTELIEKAREVRPKLPAIVITGYADAQSIASRPDDVLVVAKPFTPDQLNAAIATVAGVLPEDEQASLAPLRATA
jgi:CheY-like chemotaxis protein